MINTLIIYWYWTPEVFKISTLLFKLVRTRMIDNKYSMQLVYNIHNQYITKRLVINLCQTRPIIENKIRFIIFKGSCDCRKSHPVNMLASRRIQKTMMVWAICFVLSFNVRVWMYPYEVFLSIGTMCQVGIGIL